uniref:Reverse transcriptase zinc-binding domain-containing protein n=1 Tax=Setaria viridis TaxID=4556 RepID=A0A4U6T1C2_SETVI|nr:hypothetical protein SEVIR_9G279900v2 [Setaria viridis]
MQLDSVNCEMCILQKREIVTHLFLQCNFAKTCWASIGISYVSTRGLYHIFNQIRRCINAPFFMEVTILMSWSIWVTRNDWTFNNSDPTVSGAKRKFISEISLVASHRMNSSVSQLCLDWIQNL